MLKARTLHELLNMRSVISADERQEPELLSNHSDKMLTMIIDGARKEEQWTEVRVAALDALISSLRSIENNFSRDVGL